MPNAYIHQDSLISWTVDKISTRFICFKPPLTCNKKIVNDIDYLFNRRAENWKKKDLKRSYRSASIFGSTVLYSPKNPKTTIPPKIDVRSI